MGSSIKVIQGNARGDGQYLRSLPRAGYLKHPEPLTPGTLNRLAPAGNTKYLGTELGHYVCSTWSEAIANGDTPFSAVVIGGHLKGEGLEDQSCQRIEGFDRWPPVNSVRPIHSFESALGKPTYVALFVAVYIVLGMVIIDS
jgi:hypothetical protein